MTRWNAKEVVAVSVETRLKQIESNMLDVLRNHSEDFEKEISKAYIFLFENGLYYAGAVLACAVSSLYLKLDAQNDPSKAKF
jgi:hypothetical protein